MEELIALYREERFKIEQFMKRMVNFFQDNPSLHEENLPVVHSVKYRMKSEGHLLDKLQRKALNGRKIVSENFFDEITDLAGISVTFIFGASTNYS